MAWVKTFKKNVKLGMPEYVRIDKGKITLTSNDIGINRAEKLWLNQKWARTHPKFVRRLKKVI